MEDLDILGNDTGRASINPLNYENVKCPSCGCIVYNEGVVFKRIPGLEAGNGTEDVIYPIPVFVCAKCGELLPEHKEKLMNEKKSQTTLIV